MRLKRKFIFAILSIQVFLLCTSCMALYIADVSKEGLVLAVIQDEFRFDFNNIKSATMINNDDNTFKGLLIELKTPAVASLKKITGDAFNKEIMIIFNNKVVSSSIVQTELGPKILFSGITLADAQTFLLMLHGKQEEKDRIEAAENNKVLMAD